LSKKIGHEEDIPGVGFAFGMERLALSLYEK
jgi:histidyl-tRNA synthetase